MMMEQKPPILKFDKDPLSFHYDDNDDVDYDVFKNFLEKNTERTKNIIAQEFEHMGNRFLNEIDRKKKNERANIKKLIPYIIKHCDGKYTEDELIDYSLDYVKEIYYEYKEKRRNIFVKFIKFLLNM